ncbi:MAG: AmmeMemoRadiSam system protein B [Sulfuricurvum sp.]|uniref:AmmeMemoRadiSam system protein B n=1 Tax=Sulfuricurvum sp. TaxID=2025608 RepID=UPI0026320DA8|nr:AmmeMemoRadiSam system protein B [Sulfuricurvum sp.]MDD2829025.1 AmmeMemoRadiSam system protein B [Sulfuricurvum sp.]MDD4949672.1 AmmeMemoRadiSam system protein B [Sulfuricurvum sp.]
MNKRTMSVGGSFYPSESIEITAMIDYFNTILDSHPDVAARFDALSGNSVIVPHAGWVYSGFSANIAYRILAHTPPATVVVIGPSHKVSFEGISIAKMELFETPLGDLTINTALVDDLTERFSLTMFEQAHHEHSTEVQMPFLKHYMSDVKVVEMVYGNTDPAYITALIDYLLEKPSTAVVISTDLSHYYSLEEAKHLDTICLEAIRNKNSTMLHQGCEACGKIGVEAMLDVAHKRNMEAILLDYRTSADASGDSSRVVGYASALFS